MKKPLFNFGPPKQTTKKNKKLGYKRARKKLGIKPFGDVDRDGYLNIFDCKPLDPTKHMGVYKERKDIKHQVYDSSKGFQTEEEIFKEAEEIMPEHFGEEKGFEGGTYSNRLTKSLKMRKILEEKEGDTVVKGIVGVYDIEKPDTVSEATVFAHHHMQKYLKEKYPEKQFKFDLYKPGIVQVRGEGDYEPMKITKALSMSPPKSEIKTSVRIPKDIRKKLSKEEVEKITSGFSYIPPWYVGELPRHLTSGKKIKLEITDRPARILAKSMWGSGKPSDTFASCESLDNPMCGKTGPYSDVKHRHPIAYFYLGQKVPKKHKPSARVMIRRAHPVKEVGYGAELDTSKEFIGVAPTVYGLSGREEQEIYPYLLQKFMKKKGVFHLPLKTAKPHAGYADSVARSIDEKKDPSVYPFLREEFREKVEEKAETEDTSEGDNRYGSMLEIMEFEEEGDIIDAIDDTGLFSRIPDVYTEEFKKPISTEDPPTYKQATTGLLKMPSTTLDKPKVIPRSFFHHLLRSPKDDVRLAATKRPRMETKWQKDAIRTIKEELSKPNITPERKEVLTDRLGRAMKQLKKYKEVEPKHYHRMAGDPYVDVRVAVAEYPRLEQKTVKQLMPSKEFDVRESLFFNPALSYRQRKKLGAEELKRDSIIEFNYGMLSKETHPRVAREAVHIFSPSQVGRIAEATTSLPALHEIYKTQPSAQQDVILNPAATEAMIQQYITDVSQSKKLSSKDKKSRMVELLERQDIPNKVYQRLYNMYKTNDEMVLSLFVKKSLPKSVKEKIEGRMLKNRKLTKYLLSYPHDVSTEVLVDAIGKLSTDNFLGLVKNLASAFRLLPAKRVTIRAVIERMVKESRVKAPVLECFSHINESMIDEELIRVLEGDSVKKNLYKSILRYLMKSNRSETRNSLVENFG